MNFRVLILFGIVIIALILFLVVKNQKDKVQLEEKLNNDFDKSKDKGGDIEIDEIVK